MATIQKRGDRWRVQVRRCRNAPVSKTFRTKAQAEHWARQTEGDIAAGRVPGLGSGPTIGDLIQAYRDLREASRPIRDQSNEHYMLDHLSLHLGTLRSPKPQDLVTFARVRQDQGAGPYTINMEISKLGTVLRYAAAALHIQLSDIVGQARPLLNHLGLIGGGGKRDRRPTEDELHRICQALPADIAEVVRFAVASCMRRSEICALTWDCIDFERRLVLIRNRKHPRRKVGNDQWIPLLGDAWEIVRRRVGDIPFAMQPQTLSKTFKSVCDSLGISDLHFHDLRRHGASLLLEAGMQPHEVAAITGHLDLKILQKHYTEISPEHLHRRFSELRTR